MNSANGIDTHIPTPATIRTPAMASANG